MKHCQFALVIAATGFVLMTSDAMAEPHYHYIVCTSSNGELEATLRLGVDSKGLKICFRTDAASDSDCDSEAPATRKAGLLTWQDEYKCEYNLHASSTSLTTRCPPNPDAPLQHAVTKYRCHPGK